MVAFEIYCPQSGRFEHVAAAAVGGGSLVVVAKNDLNPHNHKPQALRSQRLTKIAYRALEDAAPAARVLQHSRGTGAGAGSGTGYIIYGERERE
jgi:hypothetical protein